MSIYDIYFIHNEGSQLRDSCTTVQQKNKQS